ncbi:sulfite exporter TauE/SafE family protein [Aureibaculum marinum]|uniref:Probable membrane transporter protein n=1 Tax=Aureibaculum marinum TaxID=2487930 RepID=A0A3N4NDH2_9FLAO|nr:sulfite exporter TauE/SafE family protein [Aureibaculum marinum]RPD93405.1 sulfite exporter TauE/SafE family protein [Aureibaculum marinum]
MIFIEVLNAFNLSNLQWVSIFIAILLLGLSKSGIKGIGILNVVILAFVFGEKSSTGVLLPMLIIADIFAVIYYHRHVQWKYILKLIPWMVVGVLIGVWVGNDISEVLFKRLMALIIITSVLILLYTEKRKLSKIPTHKAFSSSAGFLAGFATMIGNLAGPISNIYFLAIKLPKNEFIGTAAWLFFIINIFKLPFHIFIWKTITKETLLLNSILIPGIIVGFFIGVLIVKKISNLNYRKFILIVTSIGALIMLFR